jgi:predicted acylesterase/phospholipase RssA
LSTGITPTVPPSATVGACPRRLRADLPFRRPALVLSGGGALGAYEVGVLRAFEVLGLKPRIVAGVSIGAINAAVWRAHDGGCEALEEMWRRITPADVGFRWVTLLLRTFGGAMALVGLLEFVLTVSGSRELSGSYWLWRHSSSRIDLASTLLDLWMWSLFTVAGLLAATLSRRIESWLARHHPARDPARPSRIFGRVLLGLWGLYALVWLLGTPWPHRFSASVLVIATLAWLANRPGRSIQWGRLLNSVLLPETRGRGLWGIVGRQRLMGRLVARGRPQRLVDPDVRLVISALAVDSGRIAHFVSGPPPDEELVRRLENGLGEVVYVRDPLEVMQAALASSAIPGIFEPVRIRGRDFVDPGGFSNQPLHVALAADADAVLVVLLSPSAAPSAGPPPESLFMLAGRLLELANWRDLQVELRNLPPGWTRAGRPARVVVVEPDCALPGGVLGFDPEHAAQLIERGEDDAWRTLERAGWLEPVAD